METAADLRHLSELDPKLWTVLSCPVDGLEIDRETLSLIDFDQDGRVRIEEILAAVEWTISRLKDCSSLFVGGPLPLKAILAKGPEGEALLASAKKIQEHSNRDDITTVSVQEAADIGSIFARSTFNGDGIVARDGVDADLAQTFDEILGIKGSVVDRSGQQGLNSDLVGSFFADLKAFRDWWDKGESESGEGTNIFPLGAETPSAFSSFLALEKKGDDFFGRCRLAAYDERAQAPLNREAALYESVAKEDFSIPREEIVTLPIARISGDALLPLTSGLNPEWKAKVVEFRTKVVGPLGVGEGTALKADEWQSIRATFTDYRKWNEEKPDTGIEPLGIQRIRDLIASDQEERLQKIISDDLALAGSLKAVDEVLKLARMHRDLLRVLRNFVSFSDFYHHKKGAIFQAGTLFLDGKECRLCIRVADPAKHATMAALSRAFVAYCECRRKDSPKVFSLAVVVTGGDSANLRVGRNGVFRDRSGVLWDATVTRIVENPISIHEAFFLPYIKIGRFISDQMEKWATSRANAAEQAMQAGVQNVGAKPKAAGGGMGQFGGIAAMLAAGGIALGALGAGLASLFETLSSMPLWEIPLVFLGVILLISLPSMFIAWMRLRKRTLAPLLDAAGWAVNGRTLINFSLGRRLTRRAKLPEGATVEFSETAQVRTSLWLLLGFSVVASAVGWALLLTG